LSAWDLATIVNSKAGRLTPA